MAEGKHRADSPKRFRPALIIVLVALVVLGVGGYFAFFASGETASPGAGGVPTTSAETPPFEFTPDEAVPVPTSDTPVKKLRGPAQQGAANVAKTMSGLYAAAFLDPANWQSGTYDAVWGYFEPTAAAAAKQDTNELTAGTTAGDTYASITPGKSKLDVKVLFDEKDKPASYSADVVFTASATADDGTVTRLFSSGTYFLQPTSKGWKVTSYEVQRNDHDSKASKGTKASPTGPTP